MFPFFFSPPINLDPTWTQFSNSLFFSPVCPLSALFPTSVLWYPKKKINTLSLPVRLDQAKFTHVCHRLTASLPPKIRIWLHGSVL